MTEASGRTARQDEVRQERRRRSGDTLDAGQARKLAIPADIEAKLAAQGRSTRWVNDVGSRIEDLTVRDDWDKVEGVAPRPVVIDKAKGVTADAVLLSKPIAFIEEDRAKKEARRREAEKAALKGNIPGGQPLPPNLYGTESNKIERGVNQIE
jgi:hypothetical protein